MISLRALSCALASATCAPRAASRAANSASVAPVKQAMRQFREQDKRLYHNAKARWDTSGVNACNAVSFNSVVGASNAKCNNAASSAPIASIRVSQLLDCAASAGAGPTLAAGRASLCDVAVGWVWTAGEPHFDIVWRA